MHYSMISIKSSSPLPVRLDCFQLQ